MSSNTISALELGDRLIQKNFLFATKDTRSDLNFFFGDFISHYIKKNHAVVIVNLAQSNSHYTHLLVKSGLNIKIVRDRQKVVFVDAILEAGNLIDSVTQCESTDLFNSLTKDCDDTNCLKSLYGCIKRAVENICTTNPDGFIIFIDEINLLINLGSSLRAIHPFIQQLYTFCVKISNIPGNLLIGSVFNDDDYENKKLVSYLNHLADVKIQVEGLKTGFSKDTNGKVTFEIKNKGQCTSTKQKLFFKISDKGAKLLPLGI
ncbi:hypothetical protein TNIN_109891 [Trichonephila inaurata madagascariensis]|uniref:Elongator complex protein 6 n=1 Tax=Trichonephila inaurata madagascariensis TaxID=2747483 RepID=A0A8X6WMT8_9ARAC|nr:hypothetical protein TNIN_109891 [Trichonephila inaurata madagascariensis]